MQLDNKEKDVVLVDNGEVKSGLADMGSLQPKRAPPTRRLPPLVSLTWLELAYRHSRLINR